ncbi:hypothetical protein [Risungbinella massiliensis]|uniref:hypothetical protein n=1 Tax=Risungbinella massiliensis TaxID=1329796 RepID=UPI0005CC2870|nr:hypothetical protein [Risungbinella massiliensis]
MSQQNGDLKSLTNMINSFLGTRVLSEQQLNVIMQGAKTAFDRGGMPAVIEYLMKVTQADVDKNELTRFAENVRKNPQIGKDILDGKRSLKGSKKKK